MGQKLIEHRVSERILYVGLAWQVVVGFGGMKRLLRQARLHGHTHTVVSGSVFKSCGVLSRSNIEKRSLLTHHSAAACFAHLNPKAAHAVLLQLKTGGVCLLAVCDGAVLVRGDQYFDDLVKAKEAAQVLQQSSPQLTVRYIENGEDFIDSLQQYCSSATQLTPLTAYRIWPYVLVSTVFFMAVVVWWWNIRPTLDATEPISNSFTHEAVGSSYALEALLNDWYGLSVSQLSDVSCVLNQSKRWFCTLKMHKNSNDGLAELPFLTAWDLRSETETHMYFQRYLAYVEPSYLAQVSKPTEASVLNSIQQNYGQLYSLFYKDEFNSSVLIEGPLRALVLLREAMNELKGIRIELELMPRDSILIKESSLFFRLTGELL